MNEKEVNVLASLTNDAATLARRIQALTREFNRMMAEDAHTRTTDQTYGLNTVADAMRRSGQEMTTAVKICDRIIVQARGEEGS